jgi:hypothetical protein
MRVSVVLGPVQGGCIRSGMIENTQRTFTPPADPAARWQWLVGIARLNEAAALRGVHPETYKRQARAEGRTLIKLGARAVGDYRWRALGLPNPLGR